MNEVKSTSERIIEAFIELFRDYGYKGATTRSVAERAGVNEVTIFRHFGNNGMYVIPTTGEYAGEAFQFASAPKEAEMTGPWFTPDEATLFLSVQHPGEETENVNNPTSMWPHRAGDKMPRPGVVAITGFKK